MRKLLASAIVLILMGSFATGITINQNVSVQQSSRGILYVGGSEPGNYSKIQDAIDNASDGDTVFVYDDSSPYYESITIDVSINLIGEDKNTTIIDGSGTGSVIGRLAGGVAISGFTIQNGRCGISLVSDGNFIFDNIIMKNNEGIRQSNSGSNNIVKGNRIIYNGRGIEIYDGKEACNNNLFTENFIAHNHYYGIWDDDRKHGGVIATWNVIADNGYSSWTRGVFKHDSDSIYHHNDFFFNSGNVEVNGGRYDNDWDDGSEGNYWSDWKNNPGYPDTYIIPSDHSEEVDWHPSANRWTNDIVVSGYSSYWGWPIYILVNDTVDFYCKHSGGVSPYSYHWDFGDGNTSDEKEPSHTYKIPGTFEVTVTVTDNNSNIDTDIIANIKVGTGPPGETTINGPTSVKVGEWNYFSFMAIDPDEDEIYYLIDWGDGTWYDDYGPFYSGEKAYIEHRWSEGGNYTIRACARDGTYEYGPWATFNVTVKKDKAVSNKVLLLGLRERFPVLQRLLDIWRWNLE